MRTLTAKHFSSALHRYYMSRQPSFPLAKDYHHLFHTTKASTHSQAPLFGAKQRGDEDIWPLTDHSSSALNERNICNMQPFETSSTTLALAPLPNLHSLKGRHQAGSSELGHTCFRVRPFAVCTPILVTFPARVFVVRSSSEAHHTITTPKEIQ